MLTDERLTEINKRLDEANYGYGKIGGPEYAKDVKALLAEIERLKEDAKKPLLHDLRKKSKE